MNPCRQRFNLPQKEARKRRRRKTSSPQYLGSIVVHRHREHSVCEQCRKRCQQWLVRLDRHNLALFHWDVVHLPAQQREVTTGRGSVCCSVRTLNLARNSATGINSECPKNKLKRGHDDDVTNAGTRSLSTTKPLQWYERQASKAPAGGVWAREDGREQGNDEERRAARQRKGDERRMDCRCRIGVGAFGTRRTAAKSNYGRFSQSTQSAHRPACPALPFCLYANLASFLETDV